MSENHVPQLPPLQSMVKFAEEVLARVGSLQQREQQVRWAESQVESARRAQQREVSSLKDRVRWLEEKLRRQHEYAVACRGKDRAEILRLRGELRELRGKR